MNDPNKKRLSALTGPLVLAVTLLFAPLTPAWAVTLYVQSGGGGNCASWADSCDLPAALSSAVAGDEIWIKAGTYLPTSGSDRSLSFVLKSGVSLYGGFSGSETLKNERTESGNVTTLSGDIGTPGQMADNSYHVVTANGVTSDTILDRFTITAGNANGSASDSDGGGLHLLNSSVMLRNLTITANGALMNGGGIYNEGGSPTIAAVTFSANSAGLAGGGMYNLSASPSLINVTFSANDAGFEGGGIYNLLSAPSVTNVTFSNNSALLDGESLFGACSTGEVSDSILWGTTTFQFADYDGDVSLSRSLIAGGCPAGVTCSAVADADPMLGTIGDHGGLTPTIPLLAGSPAINAIASSVVTSDQRGFPRPSGRGTDMGAYEFDLQQHTVTPSAVANGSITPFAPQVVNTDDIITFTITPAPGYYLNTPVGGSCPPGLYTGSLDDSVNGVTYSTGNINANCTVAATFIKVVAPGAPTIGTATPADSSVSVSFTPPSEDGGAAIDLYRATCTGGRTATGAGSPITVSGLTNGSAYTCTVAAHNSAGWGDESAAANSATPKGNQSIAFANPGPQDFGTSPTLSASASSGLAVTFTSSTTAVCTVTAGGALTFITTGTCTIDADQAGDGSYTAAPTVSQSFTVNAVAPGAPAIGTAAAGDGSVSVSFTPPSEDGGAAIDLYRATCTGGRTATGAGSPITVSGLTNGSAYTCTVAAHNSAGWGDESAASNSVTPSATPEFFVTPGTVGSGIISPSVPQIVTQGSTTTFTITPESEHTAEVGGTCGGTLDGSIYTTNPITADCSVIATFTLNTYSLTISKTGKGTVTSIPEAITCGADCSAEYDFGTEVTLTATPASGGTFIGWSGGGCAGDGVCTVTMDAQKEISATFSNPFPWAILLPALTRGE